MRAGTWWWAGGHLSSRPQGVVFTWLLSPSRRVWAQVLARRRGEVLAGCEVCVGCDQPGRVFGVGEPGGVSAGHLVEPGTWNLVDRRPCTPYGEVGASGSEDEDRRGRDRGELRAGEDALRARAAEPVDRVHERRHGSGVLRPACGQAERLDQRVRRGRYVVAAHPLGEQAAIDPAR